MSQSAPTKKLGQFDRASMTSVNLSPLLLTMHGAGEGCCHGFAFVSVCRARLKPIFKWRVWIKRWLRNVGKLAKAENCSVHKFHSVLLRCGLQWLEKWRQKHLFKLTSFWLTKIIRYLKKIKRTCLKIYEKYRRFFKKLGFQIENFYVHSNRIVEKS